MSLSGRNSFNISISYQPSPRPFPKGEGVSGLPSPFGRGAEVYQFEMSPDFTPYRRDVRFIVGQDVPIHPLLEQLSFIKNKNKWGSAFRFGLLT